MGRQKIKKSTFKLGEDESAILFGASSVEIILPFKDDEVELSRELSEIAWTNVLIATAVASLIREDNKEFVDMINKKMDIILKQMVDLDKAFKSKEEEKISE